MGTWPRVVTREPWTLAGHRVASLWRSALGSGSGLSSRYTEVQGLPPARTSSIPFPPVPAFPRVRCRVRPFTVACPLRFPGRRSRLPTVALGGGSISPLHRAENGGPERLLLILGFAQRRLLGPHRLAPGLLLLHSLAPSLIRSLIPQTGTENPWGAEPCARPGHPWRLSLGVGVAVAKQEPVSPCTLGAGSVYVLTIYYSEVIHERIEP